MAEFQIAEQYSLPRDVAARSDTDEVEPRLDDALSDCLPDDRLVARSRGLGVVVCLPDSYYPGIEYGGAQYANFSISPINQTVDDIADALDAVESVLDPRSGPTSCYYAVRTNSIQLSSNTPGRFLTDLQEIKPIATTVERRSPIRTPKVTEEEVMGACVWPTSYGTFYLKARWRIGSTTANVHYGILSHETPLDTTPIEEFFDAFADESPVYESPWPFRQLILGGRRTVPIPNHESTDNAVVDVDGDEGLKLTHHASNPVYRHQLPESALTKVARREIYEPLQAISTLGYQTMLYESGPYVLDAIHALDPPVNHLCIVTASIERKRGW